MKHTTDTRTKMLSMHPIKLMISLSIPAIIGMVVVGLYSFMDAIFVGQMVGSSAMTSVSVAYPFTFINNGISVLLGIGSASVLARAIGRGDQNTVDKIMGNMVSLVIIFSLISTALAMVFAEQFLMLSGAEGEILDNGVKYLRIVFIGSVFINFSQAANMIMRGEGILKKAMLIMGIGASLNIILDPIMIAIFKKYGMGVEGAAIATVIAQIVQAIITLMYFLNKSKTVRIGKIRIEKTLVPEILAIGSSAMIIQIMTMVQHTIMFHTAAQYGGSEWQTFLSAAIRIQAFAFIPLWGISQGFQPAVGTNYGAKQYDRVRQITIVFSLGATLLALLLYIPIQLAPHALLSLFIKEKEIVELGITNFRLMFSLFFVFGFMMITIIFYQSLGRAFVAGILAILRQIVLFIPLVMLLPRIMNLGVKGVFLAPPIADGLIFLLCIVMLIRLFKTLKTTS